MINLKVRFKNPIFWIQVIGGIVLAALAYNGLQPQDLTTWQGVFNLFKGIVSNPYLLVLCLYNAWSAINDPTTKGITDSKNALEYAEPKKD